ncbi:MAG: hypothetical protein NZ893_03050, partial [Candidatus Aenigmarchaeota archaeon]|nr:hypothetical protein [Candidatus Aenigmarchaeota archaeon]
MAIGFLFIVITILALIVMINLSWKSISKKCWLDLNGSKKDILSSLETCIENCWSKHDFGEDTVTSDCYVINVFSNDRNIKKEDVESLKEYTKCYFEDDLLANIPYRIKVRYNYTGREVSIINWGLCGNNVLERGEFCDGN